MSYINNKYTNFTRLINFYFTNKLFVYLFLIPIKKFFRKFVPNRVQSHEFILKKLKGKNGLEIGGPSQIFSKKGLCPIYNIVNRIDNLNYSKSTLWNESKNKDYRLKRKSNNVSKSQLLTSNFRF